METPSEKGKVPEELNENVGADTAAQSLYPPVPSDDDGAIRTEPAPDTAEDDVPEPTAGGIAAEQAEKDAQAQADDPEDNKIRSNFIYDAGVGGSPPSPVEDEPASAALQRASGLPYYKCRKIVQAFKIASAESLSNGRIKLTGYDLAHSVIVDAAYVDNWHPQVGGYYVRSDDALEFWSLAWVFEEDHTPVD